MITTNQQLIFVNKLLFLDTNIIEHLDGPEKKSMSKDHKLCHKYFQEVHLSGAS